MTIRFDKTGAERKALVAAISAITGEKAQYLGAPGFVFRVGDYNVFKDGTVDTGEMGADAVVALLAALAGRGIVPSEDVEIVAAAADTAASAAAEPDTATTEVAEADAAEEAADEASEMSKAGQASDADEISEAPAALAVEFPSDGFGYTPFDNLNKFIHGKAALIRKALGDDLASGAEAFPIVCRDDKLRFPWFRFGMDADSIAAWSFFVAALCNAAKKQKRVTLREKPLAEGDSEKFAMRVFLLKLGFIGAESKEARKVILARLSGDGSHKSETSKAKWRDRLACSGSISEPAKSAFVAAVADDEQLHSTNASLKADDSNRLVRGGLCSVPATDCNYASYLRRATDAQLCMAIELMESAPHGNIGRLIACRRELKNRRVLCGPSPDGSAAVADDGDSRDCLACSNSLSEPAERDRDADRLFCVQKQAYVEDNDVCAAFN